MVYENLKFYTVEQVAKKLRVTEEVIMTIIKGKFLEAVNLGDTGIWIIEEQAILNMLQKGNNMNNEKGAMELVKGDKVEACGNHREVEYCDESVEESKEEQIIELKEYAHEQVAASGIGRGENGNVSEQDKEDSFHSISKECVVESVVDNNTVEEEIVDNFNLNNGEKESLVMENLSVNNYEEKGYRVVNNFKEENVIMEFIFDEEQAKKPVEDEIVSKGDFYDENVHVCDDQEANEQLLKKHGMAGNV